MKQAKTYGVGKGTIQAGADKNSYLGHFRNAETMKRGHNQGAPGGPTMETGGFGTPATPWAQTHQFAAAQRGYRQARRAGGDVAGATAALNQADVTKRADVAGLKSAQKAVRVARRTGGDVAAAKAARGTAAGTLKSSFAGAFKNLR